MADAYIEIAARFNGPPHSGNGGYVCGVVANHFEGTCEVTLRLPPPLGRPLRVQRAGDSVRLLDGERVVAEARRTELRLEIPPAPDWEGCLRSATAYPGHHSHPFPTCFTCGPQRGASDGLRIFPGPVPGSPLFAAPWIPHASLTDATGAVAPEMVWAALDCPSGWAVQAGEVVVLGRLAADVRRAPQAGQHCRLIAWPIAHDGRKYLSGVALLAEPGEVLAAAQATWIALPPQAPPAPARGTAG